MRRIGSEVVQTFRALTAKISLLIRMKLEDIKNQTTPEMLYHYTSQEGLIGILESRCIWASKVHYMNDSKEFSMALDLARAELRRRQEIEREGYVRFRLDDFLYQIRTIENINICVCSFSERDDSLSQWRAYSREGAGFSIGFSTEKLCNIADNSDFSLHRCVYAPNDQKTKINRLIDDILATPRDDSVLLNLAEPLAMLAPLIKDNSFEDEEEWRLISAVSFSRLDHRPSRSMIAPYFRLLIGSDQDFDCLAEVIVGPTPHPNSRRHQ